MKYTTSLPEFHTSGVSRTMPAPLITQELSTHLPALCEVQMKEFGNMHPSSIETEDCGTEDYGEQIWPM